MLATQLADLGARVDVVCTDPGSRKASRDTIDGLTVRRFPTIRGDATFMLSPSLWEWLSRHAIDYDLIHAHSYHTPLPVIAAWIGTRTDIPVVVTPHFHGTGHTWRRRLLHVPYRLAAAWMLRKVSMVICVSDAERRLLQSRFNMATAKIKVIPNGIDAQEFSTDGRIARNDRRGRYW